MAGWAEWEDSMNPRLTLPLAALLALTLPASAFAAADGPACKPPEPHPPMTVEILRNQGGDATPQAAALVNALFAHDDCLHAAAWGLRSARGSIPAVARRVMAQCRATLQAYEALELKLAHTPADLAEARSDGPRKERGIAETYVDDYRGCGL